MDGRRRPWLAMDVSYYDSNLANAIKAECGFTGVMLFDAFLRACKRNATEGQVTYGSTEDLLAQVGLSGLRLVDNSGDKWDVSRLWRVTGRHHSTACRAKVGLTTVTARQWDEWQTRRSTPINTSTLPRESKRDTAPYNYKEKDINPPTPLDCSPVLAEQEERRLEVEQVKAQRLAIVPAAKRQAKETG